MIEQIADNLASTIKTKRISIDEAADQLASMGVAPAKVREAAALLRERMKQVHALTRPRAMTREDAQEWYPGPSEQDPCWSSLKRYLLDSKGWDEDVVQSVDEASTRIVSLLDPPREDAFNTRGLVLGYVQSGKTANFTAVIAKAVDCGYRLIVVLSGIHNALRRQTQERLENELVQLNPEKWHTLTDIERDFVPPGNAAAFMTENATQAVLCVTKKNGPRLRKLLRWLSSAEPAIREACPTLIIDDESDQASVDTKGTEDPSTINRLIRDILAVLPRSGYVAYTATPFANILADASSAETLYPRDFIVSLDKPDSYYGTEQLFGLGDSAPVEGEADEGIDVIRIVPDDEVGQLRPASAAARHDFKPEVTASLEDAIGWFLCAAAVRRLRGQANRHMSMLVHTSVNVDVHQTVAAAIEQYVDHLRALLQRGDSVALTRLRQLYEDELPRARTQEPGETSPGFEAVQAELLAVVDPSQGWRVVVENGASTERLAFPDGGSTQLVVGGNTLSRGLTIEGLMVSYFLRATNYYDTLMQMGRWFGYRHGYADLPRIWMTAGLQDAFQHLARVEAEIREDISRYEREALTPRDFAPMIATHPSLAVTSPLKSRYAVTAQISFNVTVKQTTYFNHRDPAWIAANTAAARTLLGAADRIRRPEVVWGRHLLWRAIPVEQVVAFLESYRIHERHAEMPAPQMVGYIREQVEDGMLREWNIGVVTRSPGPTSRGQWCGLLPNGDPVRLINRARLKWTDGPANVKALMSKEDRCIDFGRDERPRTPGREDLSFVEWTKEHRSPSGRPRDLTIDTSTGRNTPLLLLYPIAADSEPQGSRSREPLGAVDHIVGLGIIFPQSRRLTPQSYITADLSRVSAAVEEFELPTEDDVE